MKRRYLGIGYRRSPMAENTTAQTPQTAAAMPSASPQMEKPFMFIAPPSFPFGFICFIIAYFCGEEKGAAMRLYSVGNVKTV